MHHDMYLQNAAVRGAEATLNDYVAVYLTWDEDDAPLAPCSKVVRERAGNLVLTPFVKYVEGGGVFFAEEGPEGGSSVEAVLRAFNLLIGRCGGNGQRGPLIGANRENPVVSKYLPELRVGICTVKTCASSSVCIF